MFPRLNNGWASHFDISQSSFDLLIGNDVRGAVASASGRTANRRGREQHDQSQSGRGFVLVMILEVATPMRE
jgi:hypothetical protein